MKELYLEKLRKEKAHKETQEGTIVIRETSEYIEELIPCSRGCHGYIHSIRPKSDKMISILYKREIKE